MHSNSHEKLLLSSHERLPLNEMPNDSPALSSSMQEAIVILHADTPVEGAVAETDTPVHGGRSSAQAVPYVQCHIANSEMIGANEVQKWSDLIEQSDDHGEAELRDVTDEDTYQQTARRASTTRPDEQPQKESSGMALHLLRAGVQKPNRCLSRYWLCWIGWRVAVLYALIYTPLSHSLMKAVFSNSKFHEKETSTPIIDTAVVLDCLSGLVVWWWLPNKCSELERLYKDDGLYKDAGVFSRVNNRLRLCNYFVGLGLAIGPLATTLQYWWVWGSEIDAATCIWFFVSDVASRIGTVPILGAFLLVFSVEVQQSRRRIAKLVVQARDRTLLCKDYRDLRDYVRQRSDSWSFCLGGLMIAALLNSVCFVLGIGDVAFASYDANGSSTAHWWPEGAGTAIGNVSLLGKEAVVLFMAMYLVMLVNENADSMIEVLASQQWGTAGSEAEWRRSELLMLSTTYAPPPEALGTLCDYLKTPHLKPITFSMLGIRITARLLIATIFSFMVGAFTLLLRTLLTDMMPSSNDGSTGLNAQANGT